MEPNKQDSRAQYDEYLAAIRSGTVVRRAVMKCKRKRCRCGYEAEEIRPESGGTLYGITWLWGDRLLLTILGDRKADWVAAVPGCPKRLLKVQAGFVATMKKPGAIDSIIEDMLLNTQKKAGT